MSRSAPGQISVKRWASSKTSKTRYKARQTIHLPNGTSKRIEVYGRTKTQAINKCQAKAREEIQRAASGTTITTNQIFANVTTEKKNLGRKAKTLHNDKGDYNRHIKPFIGNTPIAAVTFEDLQRIQSTLTRQRKYRTAHLVTNILRTLYRYALRAYRQDIYDGRVRLLDLAQDLPNIQPPETRKNHQTLWTLEELTVFLDAAEADYQAGRNLYYPLYVAACTAGLRRGELLGLPKTAVHKTTIETIDGMAEVPCIDVTTQLVYYDGKHHVETPKSAAGTRRVFIPDSFYDFLTYEHVPTLEKLAKRRDWTERGLLFPTQTGKPISPSSIYRHRDKTCERIGLSPIRLHDLRKVYSTRLTAQLIEEGNFTPKNLMLAMGHNDPMVAVRDYMQAVEDRKRRTVVEIR